MAHARDHRVQREHLSGNREVLMKMRWVLTWMGDGNTKARLLILGFTHPRLLEQKTKKSPTPSRRA
eukprot:4987911-Pyramimonas_sp.AAC.1